MAWPGSPHWPRGRGRRGRRRGRPAHRDGLPQVRPGAQGLRPAHWRVSREHRCGTSAGPDGGDARSTRMGPRRRGGLRGYLALRPPGVHPGTGGCHRPLRTGRFPVQPVQGHLGPYGGPSRTRRGDDRLSHSRAPGPAGGKQDQVHRRRSERQTPKIRHRWHRGDCGLAGPVPGCRRLLCIWRRLRDPGVRPLERHHPIAGRCCAADQAPPRRRRPRRVPPSPGCRGPGHRRHPYGGAGPDRRGPAVDSFGVPGAVGTLRPDRAGRAGRPRAGAGTTNLPGVGGVPDPAGAWHVPGAAICAGNASGHDHRRGGRPSCSRPSPRSAWPGSPSPTPGSPWTPSRSSWAPCRSSC